MSTAELMSRRNGINQRFNLWILERVRQRRGSPELPFTLEYRHIYVMPTMFGFWFGILLAFTAIGGLNFNNNMVLLLGFLLASIAQLTSLLAYRNLLGITLLGFRATPVFAGQAARFTVLLKNPEERLRFAIQLVSRESSDCTDIKLQSTGQFELDLMTTRRGWIEMESFRIENRYPLGFFRAWSVIIPKARCLVYPAPVPHPPPLPITGRGDFGITRKGEGEHLHGLREYQPGDPLGRIAWRTSARHQMLYSRIMESPCEEACELNWYLLRGFHTEEKLSILTAWILRAEHQQIPYSLEMPAVALPAALGEDHRNSCLEILALFEK